jgi:arsenite methyltransferase
MSVIKNRIVTDYTQIAEYATKEGSSKQRETICKPIYDDISHTYALIPGYIADADLGLGCGFPFNYASIQQGEYCADLGCASGVDSFILSNMAGSNGRVFGFDITQQLIDRATGIAINNQISNITFTTADIEELPLKNNTVDVVTSNGVFSLLPDNLIVFAEMFRILKPGGRFAISDITQKGVFAQALTSEIYKFTGCLNGIQSAETYINHAVKAGFSDVNIVYERNVKIPAHIIESYISATEFADLRSNKTGLFITTIVGVKLD